MTFRPCPEEDVSNFFSRMAETVQAKNAWILKQDVLGSLQVREEAQKTLWQASEGALWPLTWVEGNACDSSRVAGSQIWAVHGPKARDLCEEGKVLGRILETDRVKLCLLAGLTGSPRNSRVEQAIEVFEFMQRLLAQAGMDLNCLVRTWFYLHDLLEWYGDFNRVRTSFFSKEGMDLSRLPASTGVGGSLPGGSSIAVSAMAIQKMDASPAFEAIPSPSQGSATDYGSSFSRAVESNWGGHRRLFISGTASIAADGVTEHVGRVEAQMDRTLQVVEAILDARNFSLEEATRAVAYFKRPEDAHLLWKRQEEKTSSWQKLPLFGSHNTICREDLLFELELDAASPMNDR